MTTAMQALQVATVSRFEFLGIAIVMATTALAAEQPRVRFPLRISENLRYLEDQTGRQFLYNAEAAWLLFYKPSLAEAEDYLENRKRKGFTAVQVQLLPYRKDLRTSDGLQPLIQDGDMTSLNPEFLRRVNKILDMAAERQILVAIAPIWQGFGEWGWWRSMRDGKADMGKQFGRLLSAHFSQRDNLMWIVGGDADPGVCREFLQAMAEAIKQTAPHQLLTAHAGSPLSAAEAWAKADWLDVNSTYDYSPEITDVGRPQYYVYAASRRDLKRLPTRPFFLIESAYENERRSTPDRIRRQAYWSIFSGSCGHCFGNHPIYDFGDGWKAAMDSQGSRDMSHLAKLLNDLPWHKLTPDWKHEILTDGYGAYLDSAAKDSRAVAGSDYATAAFCSKSGLLVAYLPTPRSVTVDVARFAGRVRGRWFDPSDGHFVQIEGSPRNNQGRWQIRPPAQNAGGQGDWVLLIETESR